MSQIIANESLKVTIAEQGAEIISLLHNGKERVWQNETGEWAGHGPLLFPVCGHFHVVVDGKEYPISAHGFAKKSTFVVEEQGADFIRFSLSSSAETKKVYPYDFCLEITYKLSGNTLIIDSKMTNTGDKTLYYAIGGHESFALDDIVGAHELAFETKERVLHYDHNEGGYLTGETLDFGEWETFKLPEDFFVDSRTLILKDIRSRKVSLCKNGKKLVDITFDGFPNLLLWRGGAGKFICIEPWTNLPDVVGKENIEFSKKDGVVKVDAGESDTFTRTITYY